jgi:FixJ family two-component response regulator
MKAAEERGKAAVTEIAHPRIAIVDDDAAIREALKGLMRSIRLDAEAFASAEDFLASESSHNASCLILDVYLPGMSGFDLQKRLNADKRNIPIIFITAHADEASREQAIRSGAIELLGKPVRRETLFKAIQSAIGQ